MTGLLARVQRPEDSRVWFACSVDRDEGDLLLGNRVHDLPIRPAAFLKFEVGYALSVDEGKFATVDVGDFETIRFNAHEVDA